METTVYMTTNLDCKTRFVNWLKRVQLKAALQHILLLVALMVYTLLGGLVFRSVEYPAEVARLTHLNQVVNARRHHLVNRIVNNSELSNLGDLVLMEVKDYEKVLQDAVLGGLTDNSRPLEELEKWTILKAVFFSSTVITTIGYGDIVPMTTEGRAFCIVFALVGIPLTLTVIADWGRLFATTVSTLMSHLPSVPKMCKTATVARTSSYALLAVCFLFIYLAAGAGLFVMWEEDWTFFDGFYFCFITMTTIGFGDLVPDKPTYMLLATLYILIGLALTTTIIELVRRQYAQSWRQLQALSGPLADNLRKLAENAPGLDVSDLRRVLTAVTLAKKFNTQRSVGQKIEANGGDWETMEAVIRGFTEAAQKNKPPIVQVVIYESSV
ncbi:PREDICTED: TWiK family of potassium channels protein 7 [Nicrophorus vespilloides]|uniref:TWiK family of potassium channels protein 7 n=1 Tax=Nicrophorus vespilloides TaxID=110193 RepID=A0ABM1M4Z5_NICVS|nr:PREDICTED: TWiK family of potassium channels protein 7 [Nicrophorus vespilloides]